MEFHLDYYIPEIEKVSFQLTHVYIIGKNHCENKQHGMFVTQQNKYDRKFTCDYAEIFHVQSEEVHPKYFSGCKSISVEGIALEEFDKFQPSNIPMAQSNSHFSDEINQDASTTTKNINILICIIFPKTS